MQRSGGSPAGGTDDSRPEEVRNDIGKMLRRILK